MGSAIARPVIMETRVLLYAPEVCLDTSTTLTVFVVVSSNGTARGTDDCIVGPLKEKEFLIHPPISTV